MARFPYILCILNIFLICLNSENVFASNCAFLDGIPIIEHDLPSQHFKLKFVGIQAKVYRHTLKSSSTPKLRILKYSSAPVVLLDKEELIISTEKSDCVDGASSSGNSMLQQSSKLPEASAFITAISLMLGTRNGLTKLTTLVGASIALNLFKPQFLVDAQEILDCTDVMEVIIEAPPYYEGSVAECYNEVEDPMHCPLEFRSYPQCTSPAPECKIAVIGAGTGGLYTATRIVDEGKYSASDICVFEATERVGGRIYSLRGFGPDNDITVDAGAYRTWPEFTPTTHALITDYLGLQMECYEDETPCQKFNIIGNNGQKSGFATFVEEMMQNLVDEGACFFPRHELKSITKDMDMSHTILNFTNGVKAIATEDVILNIPQRPLLKIMRKSNLPLSASISRDIFDSIHTVQTEIVTKLYLYYEDAWWYKLGLTNGDFELAGDARTMLLQGRYHDGHVKCDDSGTKCHGFLLAVYTHDFAGNKAQFFRRYQRDRPEPVTIISNTDIEGAEFLKHAHQRLEEYHLYESTNNTYTGFQASQVFRNAKPPEFAVLATWNIGTYGAGGGWHHWTDLKHLELAKHPFNHLRIHVINEAFSNLQGWAEGSLLVADEVLENYFNVSRPWNFTAPDYVQFVQQTSSQECQEVEEETSGTSEVTTDLDGTVDLCFAANTMVTMQDGSTRKIRNVKKGELVLTSHESLVSEVGEVTKVLVHEVNKVVQVAIIQTKYGDLIATPSHPIFVDNEWIEIGDAIKSGVLDKFGVTSSFATRFIDYFYNLEIDGHITSEGTSTHSFVVNGIIASGLGDNIHLNKMYKRQNKLRIA